MELIGSYRAPHIRELKLSLERGFAASLESPVTDPETDW